MNRRRVKITGIGPVTPAGIGREAFWKGILEPVSRVRAFTKIDEEFGPFVAAFVDGFKVSDYVDPGLLPKGIARHAVFAVIGAILALRDAGISPASVRRSKSAVLTGSAIMDFGGILRSMDGIREKGVRAAQPRILSTIGIGSAASAICQTLEINAHTVGLSNQCISGLDAIGHAAALVAQGTADIAICGGTDAPLHRFPILELRAGGLTPATNERPGQLSRPFDRWRTTGVVSEGAAMFVLEPESSPRPAYSFVAGYGYANDERDVLCSGMAIAGRMALAEARLGVRDVDVINAWGPGHKQIDKAECNAMVALFGRRLPDVRAVSIKGSIGMPLAAAPAIQVAAAALGLHLGAIPPTVNWEFPDPECPLNLSRVRADLEHDVTLINAHGFGAVNSSLVLQRC